MSEQLTLDPEPEERPAPDPEGCQGCATRRPATDPPCLFCGADADGEEGIPY